MIFDELRHIILRTPYFAERFGKGGDGVNPVENMRAGLIDNFISVTLGERR